jgi:hypothetical protein
MVSSTTIRGDIAQAVYEGRSNKANLFIGAEVMPIYVADIRSGEYLKINLGQSEALNDDATKIAAGSAYPRVSRKFVSDTFATTEYGLEEVLPDATQRDLARFLDVEVAVADMLLSQIQIGHEARVAALTYAANGITAISGTGATAAYSEANITTFDLPADVAAGTDQACYIFSCCSKCSNTGASRTHCDVATCGHYHVGCAINNACGSCCDSS